MYLHKLHNNHKYFSNDALIALFQEHSYSSMMCVAPSKF